MVVVPTAALLANPPPLTTATLTLEEVHVTWLLTLNEVPSLKLALAVNCCEVPRAMFGLAGVTVTVWRAALLTVSVAPPTTPLNAAVIVVVPGDAPTASPEMPAELLIVATVGFEDVQVTEVVMSCVLPSAK